jgi:hypothetical protein
MRERLLKLAASRLREGISVAPDGKSGTEWNILHQDRMSNQPGKLIGHIGLDNFGQVHQSFLSPEFQGTGAARKAYGEVARRLPEGHIFSDNLQTPGSYKTWSGMFKQHISDSLAGKENSFKVLPGAGGHRFGDSFYSAPMGAPNWHGQMPQKALIPTAATAGMRPDFNLADVRQGREYPKQSLELYMRGTRTPTPGVRSLQQWEAAVPELNARYQASSRANLHTGVNPSAMDMSVTPDPIPPPTPSRKTTFADWSRTVDGAPPRPRSLGQPQNVLQNLVNGARSTFNNLSAGNPVGTAVQRVQSAGAQALRGIAPQLSGGGSMVSRLRAAAKAGVRHIL